MPRVYLDNAAATPIDRRVIAAMVKASRLVGNPSAVSSEGLRAAQFLHACRKQVADFFTAAPGEIVFTASGSESNTLAICGLLAALPAGKWNIVTAPTEHPSVLAAARRTGVQVRMCPVDTEGHIVPEQLPALIDKKTALVSLMYANNEIGTIHPIVAIAKTIRAVRKAQLTAWPYFHTDACQATAWLPMNVQNLGVDLLSINGAKAYGPRGAGVLFVRRGVPLEPRIFGGDQEHGARAGTEDLSSIAGLSTALAQVRASDGTRVAALREHLWKDIHRAHPDARLNGPSAERRLANNLNVSFPKVESERLLLELDTRGIAVSAGSACTAKHTGVSHVLTAIKVPKSHRDGALRISLSRHTTRKELKSLVSALRESLIASRAR